jgi:acyl transferase domain-containing protein/acyl carrier protein
MTATSSDEAQLRQWLVDYLVTNIGCNPDEVDLDQSLADLGLGSPEAVVLSGELAELLGRPVSPVEFWQHPTINALVGFLTAPESESTADPTVPSDRGGSVDEPIAVIGLGCRFPGDISGPDALWQFLSEGRSSVTEVPADRWVPFDDGSPEVAAVLAETTRWGSFLSDVDAFDAEFFEISPREAEKMDPQQRLLLEVAWEALEHAGLPPSSLRRSQTGVFAGACVSEYGYLASTDLGQVDAWTNTGGALSIIANRLSYFLDLRGPSIAVDTACSSSLVAVHLACQSLRMGDSELAIAAGVNLLVSPGIFRGFDQAGALSTTGRCHAFDAAADGFVRGEGCGVVVLKRLGDALRDGNRVLAVVRGSALNQDGRSNGLMAPNPAAQTAVLRAAYANAGVPPHEVDYVETHGTGTFLGDPIEARALGTVLGRGRPENSPLLIGAIKSNLGHLEAAAGIAGLIKAVLAVQRGHIPPNMGFEAPNPHIPFEQMRLKVVADHQDWPLVRRPRRAGVSAFGFGGANAHVVIEQGPDAGPVQGPEPAVTSMVVSGKTSERVASLAGVLADWMEDAGAEVALADIAHTLNHHRTRHENFATVCACDRGEAVAGLRALAAGQAAVGVVGPHEGPCRPGTVFVYSGQGSQWAGMGRQLLTDEPAFAAAVAELEPVFVAQAGFSLQQALAGGEPVTGIDRIQPVLVGMQLALTALWRSYGVEPDAVIGHSMGEVTAAVVAGALTVAEGLQVIATRSRLMARLSGQGAMALLELDGGDAEALIAEHPQVTVAVYASPRQTVIAGPPEQIDQLIAMVAGQGRLARRVDVDVASHHPIIEPVLPELRAMLAGLAPKSPSIPIITTVDSAGPTPAFDAEHWAANLRNPVRFSQAIATAGQHQATFIEISPHPLLAYAIKDILAGTHHHSIGTLQREVDETLTFHTNLNATHSVAPPRTPHPPEPHPPIPTTPWHHTRHWISAARQHRPTLTHHDRVHPLLGAHVRLPEEPERHAWQGEIGTTALPWLADHQIHSVPAFPAAAYCEMALAAARTTLGDASEVRDISFEQMLLLDEQSAVTAVASIDAPGIAGFAVQTDDAGERVRRAAAALHAVEDGLQPARRDLDGLLAAHPGTVSGEEIRLSLAARGIEFGPAFTGLSRVHTGADGATLLAEIGVPAGILAQQSGYGIHPAVLDGCFQSVGAHLLVGGGRRSAGLGGLLLPLSIGRLRRFGAGRDVSYCHVTVTKADSTAIEADLEVLDENGEVVLEVSQLRMGSGASKSSDRERLLAERLLTVAWEQGQPPTAPAVAGVWLLISSGDADASSRDDLPTDLADALVAGGAQCRTAHLGADAEVLARDLATDGLTGVVIVTAPAGDDPNEGCLTRGRELVAHVVHIARELSDTDGQPPRLYVVTRNAQAVTRHDRVNLDQGGVRGLVRVIGAEQAPLRPTQIDVDPRTAADQLAQELLSGSDEDETAWREGLWYTARLRRTPLQAEERRTTLADPESDGMRLQIRTPGDLQTLELVAAERPTPAAGQVEVAVSASSINFADVLAAFGRYPTFDGKQPQLGLDFAGVVAAVGPGVTEHRVGDKVGGFGTGGCWGTYVTSDARLVAALPAGLTAEQAAAVSTGYGTAWYGLCDLARIGPGDRVLIHSATGGVGQAAIAIARQTGAEIFATAGSPGRRQLLRDMGIEHVYDSRSTDFADEIRRDTDGYGVDVVLNSLVGPAQRAGLELLAFGGRFVEIGKRDVYEHTRIDLYPFRRNLTFYYADLALMTTGDPKRIGALLRKVYESVGDGVLPVPEHTVYPLTEAAGAIRAISAAEHTGKLVLSVPRSGATRVAVPPNRAPVFRSDGSYLVTGGAGGLGLFLAAVMASGGCERIVLTSRSQPNPQAQKMITRLRSNGADIVVECGNIADPDTAERLVSAATATGLPLRGVLHAAAVVDDATLDNITDELIERDWAPKVCGAWYLHQAAADQPLDWFCNFSSAAGLLGSPGQGAYAAANSWLDAFTSWQRSQGVPASAIAWGAWADIGRGAGVAQRGDVTMISPEDGGYAFRALLRHDRGYTGYLPLTGMPLLTALAARSPFAEAFRDTGDHRADGIPTVLAELAGLAPDEWPNRLRRLVTDQVGLILRRSVDPDRSFAEHGLDSLGTLELRTHIETQTGIRLTPKSIVTHSTPRALAGHLTATLEAGAG